MHKQAQTGITDYIHAVLHVCELLDLLAFIFCHTPYPLLATVSALEGHLDKVAL